MLKDDFLVTERPHPLGGIQRIHRFPDGHGLSIVNSPMLHAYPFAWECAVLENVSEDGNSFELTYDTDLTSDVEVFDTDQEMNSFIDRAITLFGSNKEIQSET